MNPKPSKDQKKSARSNSTLTSKEVEFQNWKRRKSYDPMKAAAEGRKKLIDSTKKHHSTEDSSGKWVYRIAWNIFRFIFRILM